MAQASVERLRRRWNPMRVDGVVSDDGSRRSEEVSPLEELLFE